MVYDKLLSTENLQNFNFEETIKNVISYFKALEKLRWEWAKLSVHKGLTANYDFSVEFRKQPYIPIGKDEFKLSAKENKEEQLKHHISSYYWALSLLSDEEQLYIEERFNNHKYEDELVDLFGFINSDCKGFRKLKKSAIYKFADFLGLVVEIGEV